MLNFSENSKIKYHSYEQLYIKKIAVNHCVSD